MEIVTKKLSEIKEIERNVRKHPQKQIDEMVRSIERFGQIRPMVIDEEGVILAGNGLYRALLQMGETEGRVLEMKNLSEKDKKRLIIADNKLYELGLLDNDYMMEVLEEIGDNGEFDVPGFDEEILKDLFAGIDDITDTVGAYGELDDATVDSLNEQGERAEGKGVEREVHIGNENIEVDKQSRAYIHCPNCNEKIWL